MNAITVTKNAARSLRNFFCWVYSNELIAPDDIADGEIVDILAPDGTFLARGYLNRKSTISVRVLAFERREIDASFFEERIRSAYVKRKAIAGCADAYRVVHSEADFLPGLIVDSYNGYLAIQINTLGMERLRAPIIDALRKVLNPIGIIDKSDAKVRAKEGLETRNGVISGTVPETVTITENGIKFSVNLHEGQKTGFYLDQRRNRRISAEYVGEGMRVLDVFCNAGGFGLYALRNGADVRFVDLSEHALTQVRHNLELNGFPECDIIRQDAFDFLTLEKTTPNRYDAVFLDPPPFAKTKKEAEGAIKGFKFLFSAGLSLTKPGGIVALYSCSHHIGEDTLLEIAREASAKAGVPLEVLELQRADNDHPYILNIPNSAYLSGIIVRKTVL
ncbi:class I SAM-dependent rRNA methyltransferase [Sulfuricurvum sp. IAE1]|jgi:23S rRNA (cytosine1962-C5)-methyltransferase|uniref:class I SAM-dependent rRNA methyltransferase n=1 Tax=Sulfuricurvum sp. IAE1 TaxID=2546102 RepID=UPI00104BB2C3|nr:class I SAM-dependent rRNA methyltransferase [Sulfuricurvum sp. IAE1]MDX9966094.1 class I SAM-dependent rRNA methyltransferase [Sulfuricurvum sp.]TDA64334.1 class I SAM-dependent rRNA methyltransferase [Sulfuricurvum sp. IAE1]